MFSFLNRKTKSLLLCDNSCNVTYCQFLDNLHRSIIIYDNSKNIISRTPIPSLDLENPTDFKIYQNLNELDDKKIYYKENNEYFDLSNIYMIDTYTERAFIVQHNIKIENIKKFISCFDK